MLTLMAKAVHLSGEVVEVRGVFGLDGGSLGRGAECDLVLPDPDRRISRLQAWVSYSNGNYLVVNASTSNPMYVNGVELSPGSVKALNSGDELRAGSYVLVVQCSDEEPATAVEQVRPTPDQRNEKATEPVPGPAVAARDGSAGIDALIARPSVSQGVAPSNPFADLLGSATTGSEPALAEPMGQSGMAPTQSTPACTANQVDGPSVPLEKLDNARALGQAFTQEQRPALASLAPPIDVQQSSSFDPADPFADLLKEAAPLGNGSGQHPLSQDSLSTSLPLSPSTRGPEPRGLKAEAIPDPFALPRSQSSPHTIELGPGADNLSRLAGDPFADLMGAPVQEQLANVELSVPGFSRNAAGYIPHDFNPMDLQPVSDRNSADPLSPLGRGGRGLQDVLPKSSVDSIFDPCSESPTALAVDPLDATSNAAMQISESVDPLRLFDSGKRGFFDDSAPSEPGRSAHNHAREMASFFRPPTAVEESANTLMHDLPGSPSTDVNADPLAPVGLQPLTPLSVDPISGQGAASLPVSDTPPGEGGAGQDAQPDLPAIPHLPSAHGVLNAGEGVPVSLLPSTAALVQQGFPGSQASVSDASALVKAFLKGAGLEALPAEAMTPELMETVGRLISISAQGMVDLLAGRAAVKQEVHLSVTLINPKSNNPLKFLPDGRTALLQMLGPKMPGFMPAVEAMEEAIQDLVTHQTAIAAGTQATIEALFRRFDPATLEASHSQLGMGEKMSRTLHRARLWSLYVAQYAQIREEVKDGFFKRLGAEFQDAYNKEYERDRNQNDD